MTDPPSPTPDQTPSDASRERQLLDAVFGQAAERPSAFSGEDAGSMPPPDTFPGYELLNEIHRGGQGVVYLAVQKATKRRVAIKVLHEGPFGGSSGRSRFEREVQILGQLNHPNIVHIHDSGMTPSGSFFYVMDYISGRPLDDLIEGRSAAPAPPSKSGSRAVRRSSTAAAPAVPGVGGGAIDDVLRLFLKICDGVNAAHLKGVIHRDLKPANIRVDQRGEPIVVDFGLAKVALTGLGESSSAGHPAMTMTGQFIGSLPWASPEQADGSPDAIDLRTDVYSLGVILYQLLTGKFPYSVIGNMRDVLDNILRAEPARPSTVRRQINGEVETIVLKCLAKDKGRRYQSAGELARDIERYLAGEPIEAKRDSALYLISKTLKKHRVTAGVLLAFVGVIVIAAAGMSVLYGWERQARKDEQEQRKQAVTAKGQAEAERDRATRNFQAGRALARAFIYDFSRDIAGLRGATPARERLAREASEYLNKLRGEIGDNPEMLRDLADAYAQLGRIQGGLYLPRVGTTEQAAESFGQSRAIRQGLLERFPGDPRSLADVARAQQEQAWIAERAEAYPDAIELYQKAIEGWTAASARAKEAGTPLNAAGGELARCISAQGDAYVRLAEKAAAREEVEAAIASAASRYDRAQAEWSRLLSATPPDEDARRALATLESKRSAITMSRGRAAAEQAEALLKPLARGATPPERAVELLAEAATRLDEAAGRARAALDKFGTLAENDPASGAAERDIYVVCNNLGLALSGTADLARVLDERLGLTTLPPAVASVVKTADGPAMELARRTEALAVYGRGLAIARRLAENDAKNIEAQRDWAVMLNKVGNEQRFLARLDATPAGKRRWLDQSLQSYTRSLELRTSLYKTDATARQLRDLALGEYKFAQVHLAIADAANATSAGADDADARTRRDSHQAAWRYASSALEHFDTLRTVHKALAEDAPALVEARELREQVRGRGYGAIP